MNILYLTNHLNIGGITSYVLTLSTGMKARGHNIYVASSGGKLISRFREIGITYIPIPINTKKELSPKILISRFRLSNIIKQFNIDIIHSNSRTTQVLGCLLSRAVSIPHIFTCHGFFKRRVLRRIFPCWGQKVIAISESVKEHLIKDFKVKENDINVVHNGIDIEKFKVESLKFKVDAKKQLGLGNGLVVGIVARLSDVKGHRYLIEAMRQVIQHIPQAQLLVVGEGKEREGLVRQVESLGMSKDVFFVSEVSDTRDVLSVMDLFVMPSLKEGLGLSLMEAMASGLCVMGSDVGGIRSLIQDNYNGRLVKPADTNALACAIIELLQDGKIRESLGRQAQVFIAQNFSQEKMVLETERVYLECLSAKY